MTLAQLIPTQHRDKLQPGLSYPVKASELTTLLENAPELERCSIYFSDRPIFWKSKHQATIKAKGEVCVFRLQEMYLDDGITITVNAVPSDHRLSVRDTILSASSKEIVAWFLSAPIFSGQESIGRRPLSVFYTLASRTSRVK